GVPASASEERRRYLQLEDFDALFELGRELEANDRREEAEACWHPIAEVHAGGALGMAWIALQSGDDRRSYIGQPEPPNWAVWVRCTAWVACCQKPEMKLRLSHGG